MQVKKISIGNERIMNIKIGTRGSKLALIQTEYVINRLKEKYPDKSYEIVVIKTKGDIVLDKPLNSIGFAGVFVKEIEEKLKLGEIDMAVHSMKDMPVYPAEGLVFSRLWEREDNRDVLIINGKKNPEKKSFMELPTGAVIGTGSIRRSVMLRALRSDIRVVNIRGNVDTRLKKMEDEGLDGIVLAAAGLKRMGMESIISCYFDDEEMTPAPTQGILALECREADVSLKEMLDSLSDETSDIEGTCEREFLREMGADCHVPVGASCKLCENKTGLSLKVFYGRADGSKTAKATVTGSNTKELAQLAAKEIRKKLAGKVWLVGAGPGDIGLLTVRGKEIIEQADCIVYDRLANEEILKLCRANCEKIYVGKENRHHTMRQEEINRLLVKKSMEYDNVVRLKGGDPYVFGRGGEEGIALVKAGVTFETIPGVTSAIAGLSYAKIPITHRGISGGMRIVTAHNKKAELADIDFDSMARGDETLVFMMGLSKLDEICQNLIKAGMDKGMPAAVISNATTARQKTVTGKLCDIAEKVKKADGIVSPALIVVGNVVKLRAELNVSNGLEGDDLAERDNCSKKYIIPKIGKEKSALSDLVRKKGGNPIEIQVGSIETIDVNIDKSLLQDKKLIIFTSSNGINCFFENLYKSRLDTRSLYGCKIAAIGLKTANSLRAYGITADIIPKTHNSDELLKLIKENMSFGDVGDGDLGEKILYIKGKNVKNSLTEQLKSHVSLTCLEVYENKKAIIEAEEKQHIMEETKEAAGILFTCASNVERFFEIIGDEADKRAFAGRKIISIGEKCSSALKNIGITNYVQAEEASYESMADEI